MNKKLLITLSLLLLLLIAGYFIASPFAVKFLNSRLRNTLGPGTTISRIDITSRYIIGHGVVIEEPVSNLKLLEIDEILLFPAFRSLLSKNIVISKVILKNPVLFIYRINDSTLIAPGLRSNSYHQKKSFQKSNKSGYNTTIDNINIDHGKVIFSDHIINTKPVMFTLFDVKSSLKNLNFPSRNNKSQLSLQCKFPGTTIGKFNVNGWFYTESSDCNLQIKLDNADLLKFYPYYMKYIGNMFSKGSISTDATVKITNRYLNTNGNLQLNNLVINEQNNKHFGFTSKDLASLVKNNNGQIDAAYKIDGNLQDKNFDFNKELFESISTDLLKSYGKSLETKGKDYLKKKGEEEKENLKEKAKRKKDSIEHSIEKFYKKE